MKIARRLTLTALVVCACARSDLTDVERPSVPASGIDILFIGNSLTYANDLPRTVAEMAAAMGQTVRITVVAVPNLAVIDHALGYSNAIEIVQEGGWEYVVLQQAGTSTGPGVYVDTLILATKIFDGYVRAQGGRTALYMTWPTIDRFRFFDNTLYAYRTAAESVNGILLPAGEAWRTAWKYNPDLEFYSGDGLHPTEAGSFLAALVIYERLTGTDARTLPALPRQPAGLGTTSLSLLKRAAHETVQTFR